MTRLKNPKKSIDSVSVARSTDFAKSIAEDCVRHALEYLSDSNKEKRINACECKTCFYLRSGRIGGASMTSQECAICSNEVWYGSTNTDPLCEDCSAKHELCKRCTGDVHMRPRRIWKG